MGNVFNVMQVKISVKLNAIMLTALALALVLGLMVIALTANLIKQLVIIFVRWTGLQLQ